MRRSDPARADDGTRARSLARPVGQPASPRSALPRLRTASVAGSSDRRRADRGHRVLCTVVFAAAFLGGSELVDQRLVVVALLIIAGSTLVGATR